MIRPILTYPRDAKRLHEVSAPVILDGPSDRADLEALVADMFETMYAAGGIGLAAIQVNEHQRVFVMDVHEPYVFINPKPLELSGAQEQMNEGCLSLPGVTELVTRNTVAVIEAQDTKGEWRKYRFTGMEAQCVQHEYEHLAGHIIPDSLSSWRREKLLKQLAKGSK